jgi:hypothetical protein
MKDLSTKIFPKPIDCPALLSDSTPVIDEDSLAINQCCGSGMLIPDPGSKYFHPASWAKKILDPVSESASKNLSIFNPKKRFLSSHMILGFFTHPGSRYQKGTGSRIRVHDTAIITKTTLYRTVFH